MVTREFDVDRRYGLGKSLLPVVDEMSRDIRVSYLTQDQLGPRSRKMARLIWPWLARWLRLFWRQTETANLAWGLLERINMGRLAAQVARAHGVTHVHCHDPFIAAGYRWFARSRRPWGVTQHGFGSYVQAFHEDGARLDRKSMSALRRWERRLLARAAWVVLPTASSRRQLARDLMLPDTPAHWHVIPHPRPSWVFPAKRGAREQLGFADELVVVAVGRHTPLKGFERLVRGFAAAALPQARLIILGGGDTTALRSLADTLQCSDRLTLTATDDMPTYYAAADAYISVSDTESFGMANLEALVAGLPSVCTAVGGVPDVVGNGAWLIPAQDVPAVTEAFHRLSDEAFRNSLAKAALQRGCHWPDAGVVARAYLAMYRGGRPRTVAEPAPQEAPPSLQMLDVSGGPRVLVIAPHPDDETLGCGGLLSSVQAAGGQARVVVVTDGGRGDPEQRVGGDTVARRAQEVRDALIVAGLGDVVFLGRPDGALQADGALVESLLGQIEAYRPDWVLGPWPGEGHPDHQACGRAARAAWQQAEHPARFLHYEVWGGMPINRLLDIGSVIDRKRTMIECFVIPRAYCDYVDAFMGLARHRGLGLTPVSGLAEAFFEPGDAG